MILIGSRAAVVAGCLPTWRNGRCGDWDLICDHDEADSVRDALSGCFEADDRTDEYRLLFQPGIGLIEISIYAKPSARMIAELSDNIPADAFGIPCLAISAKTQLAIKMSYSDRDINREKNDRDISFWRDEMGVTLDAEHIDLMNVMRAEMIKDFGSVENKSHKC